MAVDLNALVARLEKVREQLDKKQTDKLRAEHHDLMVQIQQERQRQREGSTPDPNQPAPTTVSGSTGVNED